MFRNNLGHQRQSQPGAILAPRNKGLEDFVNDSGRNAGAVVDDLNLQRQGLPGAIGAAQAQAVFIESSDLDFAFAIHNSQDAGLSGQLEVDSGAGFEIVAEFSGVTSNKPMLYYFGDKQTSTQRLTLNFTSKLYIGSINVGNAIVFQRPPSLGYQQASTAPLDKVEQFTTEGNNFIVGRRLSRGFQDKGTFRFLSIDEATWFEDYQNHVLDSKTLYFKWNNQKPQTTYGLQNPQNLTKPTYVTDVIYNEKLSELVVVGLWQTDRAGRRRRCRATA